MTTLVAATVLYLLASTTQGDSNAPLAVPLFAYSVGLTRPVRVSATMVGLAALALSTSTFYGPGEPDALIIVLWFLLFGLGWAVAVIVRRSQDRTQRLSQAVDDLAASQASSPRPRLPRSAPGSPVSCTTPSATPSTSWSCKRARRGCPTGRMPRSAHFARSRTSAAAP